MDAPGLPHRYIVYCSIKYARHTSHLANILRRVLLAPVQLRLVRTCERSLSLPSPLRFAHVRPRNEPRDERTGPAPIHGRGTQINPLPAPPNKVRHPSKNNIYSISALLHFYMVYANAIAIVTVTNFNICLCLRI